jgi:hypothetical protein
VPFGFTGGSSSGGGGEQTNVPLASKDYVIVKLQSGRAGAPQAIRKNQSNILIRVLDAFFNSGHWRCDGSSDTVTGAQDGVNRWTTPAALNHAANPNTSWILFTNTKTGRQYRTIVSVAGAWLEIITHCSLSAAFTGGTVIALPTAPDQFQVTPIVGADWLGTSASEGTDPDPLFHAWVWFSTDGEVTRVVWTYETLAGALAVTSQAIWKFETLNCPAPGTVNWSNYMVDNGNGYTTPAAYWTLGRYSTDGRRVKTATGNVETCFATADQFGADYYIDKYPRDPGSAQVLWQNPVAAAVALQAAPRNGIAGWDWDHWWIGCPPNTGNNPPVFPAFDTVGGRSFILVDANMWVWDGSAVPGQPGSTDHLASAFFGRGSL